MWYSLASSKVPELCLLDTRSALLGHLRSYLGLEDRRAKQLSGKKNVHAVRRHEKCDSLQGISNVKISGKMTEKKGCGGYS